MKKCFKKIAVLTGAGISQESGLKTFRDADGLWEGHRVEEVATPEAYAVNPKLVQKFYNERRKQLKEVDPNLAHETLAKFEKLFNGDFLLITQNVDDLHERAGSQSIIHMHGELLKARCNLTGEIFECDSDLDYRESLRPHIVWFGEMPLMMEEIYHFLQDCDLFVAIGTSGNVYPAAGFVQAVNSHCHKVEINLQTTKVGSHFDEFIEGKATEAVTSYFDLEKWDIF